MWWIYVSRFVCSSLFLFFLFVPDLAFLPVAETSRLIRLGFRRVIIPDDTGFRFTIGWMASDLGGIPRGGAGLREEKSRERLNGEGGGLPFLLGLQDSMRILDGRSIRRNEAADHNGKVAGWSAAANAIYGERRNKRGVEEEKGEALFCTWCVRYVCTCIFLLPFVREGARAGG